MSRSLSSTQDVLGKEARDGTSTALGRLLYISTFELSRASLFFFSFV
jgi:hypothetical protein